MERQKTVANLLLIEELISDPSTLKSCVTTDTRPLPIRGDAFDMG